MIKCIVWDLDETLWEGVLSEGDAAEPRREVEPVLKELDQRGILHSVASRNEQEQALAHLDRHGLRDYFVYPQVGWSAKSVAISKIAEELQLSPAHIAFVDNCPRERAEVALAHPQVLCLDAEKLSRLTTLEALKPVQSGEGRRRRLRIQQQQRRQKAEREFTGPSQEFLRSLDLRVEVFEAAIEDLDRAQELTARTTQLNSTGVFFSSHDLQQQIEQGTRCWLVRATDRFGDYGTVAMALVDEQETQHHCRLLLTSCRVLNQGVGGALLVFLMRRAVEHGAELTVDFRANSRNRMMDISLRLAGFSEAENGFGWSSEEPPQYPPYLSVSSAPSAFG